MRVAHVAPQVYTLQVHYMTLQDAALVADQPLSMLRDVISSAEAAVLEVLAAAAFQGDYHTIDLARETAERLRHVRKALDTGDPISPEPSPIPRRSRGTRGERRKSRERGRRNYPRFEVHGSSLVKIGWSKKKAAEYTQRIPEDVFQRVVAGLQAIAQESSGPISSESILAGTADLGGDEVPSYQTYAVLRFLRHHDVVRQTGRGEYFLPANVGELAATAWGGDVRGEHNE